MIPLIKDELTELILYLNGYFYYFPVPLVKIIANINKIVILAYRDNEKKVNIILCGTNHDDRIDKVKLIKLVSIKGDKKPIDLFKDLTENILYEGYRYNNETNVTNELDLLAFNDLLNKNLIIYYH